MNAISVIISANDAGQRLDRFLRKAYKATPYSLIQKALRKGKVRVNGKKAKADLFLAEGDSVECKGIDFKRAVPMQEQVRALALDLTPLILHEDERFIVVNKPAGLPVHSGAFHESDTLIDLIKAHAGTDPKDLTFSPALAHRLDKGVSGAILAAKTADALRLATEAFRDGNISKQYLALVQGEPAHDSGVIETPLENKQGKLQESETRYKVIRRMPGHALLSIDLLTGRTHQIRRHLSEIGHPILGDEEYGGRGAVRIMLHSYRLELFDWKSGVRLKVEAPMPDAMKNAVKRLEQS